jgi:SAM-dependent methyltransferase
MTSKVSAGAPVCPICSGSGRPLLSLPRQPIYQHPVAPGVVVPAPHSVDLAWVACSDCSHAWQPDFDSNLLEQIYKSYYYTPAPDNIAVQFREEFLAAMEKFGLAGPRHVLLEVGASGGDVIAELKKRTQATRAYVFEPNTENAVLAKARKELNVVEDFFTSQSAAVARLEPVDLIYARHVIEHIFDFENFFDGVNAVTGPGADLVLETPSLDFHAKEGSLAPFHVEHIHVFALRSLARLAARHGWGLTHSNVTGPGNLIACFKKGAPVKEVAAPALDTLQRKVAEQRERLMSTLGGRKLVFWGAGSAGVSLVSIIGREPDLWTDGNPNKVGKHFVGLTRQIVSPDTAFREARAYSNPMLVIASSFVDEILPRVRSLGWTGAVCDSAGRLL